MPTNHELTGSRRIFQAIWKDLHDRKGFDDWWDSIDPEIQREIKGTLFKKIDGAIASDPPVKVSAANLDLLMPAKRLSQSIEVYFDDPDNEAAFKTLMADMEDLDVTIVAVENAAPPEVVPKDAPLAATVMDGRLVMSIGVSTLAHAAANRPTNPFKVTDEEGFAKDVLEHLSDDNFGTNPLEELLDTAMELAVDLGSPHVEEVPDED